MRYNLLGKSGLRVSELCLGTMTFGEDWGWGASKDESRQIFDTFVEAGGNFIDTANGYTDGSSEKIVGELIANDRERFVVATKYSFPDHMNNANGNPNASGNHRKNLMQSLDRSLKRLDTDYVDLFWLHAWDFTTPVEEVLRAFDDTQVKDNLACVDLTLSPEHLQRLNEVSQVELGFPHDFLSNDTIRDRLFGGTFEAMIILDKS